MKKYYIIGFTVILLAILSFTLTNKESGQDERIGKFISDDIYGDDVDQILIETQKDSFLIRKKKGEWTLESLKNYRVHLGKLRTLFEEINRIRISSIVTKNVSSHGKFKVLAVSSEENKEDSGTHFLFKKEGQVILDYIVGGYRSPSTKYANFGGQYFRFGNEDKVYVLQEELSCFEDQEDWVDKGLLKFDPVKIKSVSIQDKINIDLSREKNDEAYRIGNKKIDSKLMNGFTKLIEKLKIEDVLKIEDIPFFKKKTLEIGFFDGSRVILNLGEKNEDETYLVKLSILNIENSEDPIKYLNGADKKWLFRFDQESIDKVFEKSKEL